MNIKRFLIGLIFVGFLAAEDSNDSVKKELPTTLSAFFKENPDVEISFDLTKPTTLKEFFEQNPLVDAYFRPELPEERIQLIRELVYNRWRNSMLITLREIDNENIDEKLSLYPNKNISDEVKKIEYKELRPNIHGIVWGDNEYLEEEVKHEKEILEKNISKSNQLKELYSQIGPDNVDSYLTRFGHFISDNKTASIGAGIVIICAASYAIYNWYQKKQNAKQKDEKKEDDVLNDFINLA